MAMSEIIIVWAAPCIYDELRDVDTIRRARWNITWQGWNIDNVEIEVIGRKFPSLPTENIKSK